MRRILTLALTMTSLLTIACSGSAPTSPSRAAVAQPSVAATVAQSTPSALLGAGIVDFSSCLQTASAPGCFTAPRVRTSAVTAAALAPSAPAGLTATAVGSTVTLTWLSPASTDRPDAYIIEAGSTPGAANLANFSTGTNVTTFSASGVGAGSYYVRVRASNSSGASAASDEVLLVVGGGVACTSAPGAPTGLVTSASGSTVTLTWSAPAGGCASSSYVLQAGSSAGASDLANANVGAGTSYVASGVGNGTYYVRVRAVNAYGQSAGSNEAVATVTAGTPTPVPGGVGGTWIGLAPDGMTTQNPQCPRDVNDLQFVLTQTGSNITGTVIGRIRESFYPPDVGKSQTGSVTGSVNGNAFSFAIDFVVPIGQGPRRVQGTATFTSTRMTGTINSVPPDPCTAGAFAVNRQ